MLGVSRDRRPRRSTDSTRTPSLKAQKRLMSIIARPEARGDCAKRAGLPTNLRCQTTVEHKWLRTCPHACMSPKHPNISSALCIARDCNLMHLMSWHTADLETGPVVAQTESVSKPKNSIHLRQSDIYGIGSCICLSQNCRSNSVRPPNVPSTASAGRPLDLRGTSAENAVMRFSYVLFILKCFLIDF